MSFLTEYFDNYRKHPFKKAILCYPEQRYAPIKGNWLQVTTGTDDSEWSDQDVAAFIKRTMANLRGRSTYYNDYCGHLPEDLKTRPFVPRPKKQKPCPEKDGTKVVEKVEEKPLEPLNINDTELMMTAKALYERDLDHLVLEPLPTHHRILGYARPRLYGCDTSDYTEHIAQLAFTQMRDGLTKPCVKSNGNKKEYIHRSMITVVPYDGESIF